MPIENVCQRPGSADLSFRSTHRRYNVKAAIRTALRISKEGYLLAIRRPSRASFAHWILSDAQRCATADEFHIDVVIVFFLAVPYERYPVSIGRERGLVLTPGIARERDQRWNGHRSIGAPKKTRPNG